jgi:hypothetical protein
MAMLIESGCWGCDAGPGPIVRVYKDSFESVRQEELFSIPNNGLPRKTYESANGLTEYVPISDHAATDDGSVLAVSVCLEGSCEFSGLSGFDPTSEGIAYRSFDGGITWQEVGRGGPMFKVAGVLHDGRVLVKSGTQDDGHPNYSLLPDGTPVQAPEGGWYPVVLSNRILWAAEGNRLLNSDGSLFFQPPDEGRAFYNPNFMYASDPGGRSALLLWDLREGPGNRFAIGQLDTSENEAIIVRQWEIEGYLWTIGWWSFKDDIAVVSIVPPGGGYSSPRPAIVDLAAGIYSLIPGPFLSPERPDYSALGRTAVQAVQTGPFARVTGTNSCLRVRAAPSLSGEVLDCMVDGVLLTDLEDTVDADGQTWARVMTPGGVQGWASAGYLER